MGVIKAKKGKTTTKKSSIGAKIAGKAKSVLGGGGRSSGTRRHKGVAYYQNAVLKERLKKKLNRLKYGGR